MNGLIEVLKEESQRQKEWVKSKGRDVDKWFDKHSYDYSKSLPKNYIIPKPITDKAIKWFRILFVVGLIFALYF